MRGVHGIFADEPLGTRQMIVVGGPAKAALLLPDSHEHFYNPWLPTRSDYIGAVGADFAETLALLAGILEEHAGDGAGDEMRAVFGCRL